MKNIIAMLLLLILVGCAPNGNQAAGQLQTPIPADNKSSQADNKIAPADNHWIQFDGTGTGKWSDHNHWSLGHDPDKTENAIFDASSFSGAGEVVTVDITATCLNMDWTGSDNGGTTNPTLTTNSLALYIYGNAKFIANMKFAKTGWAAIGFRKGPEQTLTTGGANLLWTVLIGSGSGAPGNLKLLDNFTGSGIAVYEGAFDSNGQTVSCGTLYDSAKTTSKTLKLGRSAITCNSVSFTGGALTLTDAAHTITFTDRGIFTSTAATIGSWGSLNFTGTSHTINGSFTCDILAFKPNTTQTITFTDGTTVTVTTPLFTGSIGKIKTLKGSGAGGWNLVKAGGGIVEVDYITLSNSHATPGSTWYFGTNSKNYGNNTGWRIVPEPPLNPSASTTSSPDPVPGLIKQNRPPVISEIIFDNGTPVTILPNTAVPALRCTAGTVCEITCLASDADKDKLRYTWSTNGGRIVESGNKGTWFIPGMDGVYKITVTVHDIQDALANFSIIVTVRHSEN